MGELNLSSILDSSQIDDLFDDTPETEETKQNETVTEGDGEQETIEQNPIEADPDDLFGEQPESVDGSEVEEEDAAGKQNSGSPKNNSFYSSIATALKNDGIFSNLNTDTQSVKDAEGFANLIREEINSRLDETQKRVEEALGVGIQPSAIQSYERSIAYLDKITEDDLESETEAGEAIRKDLIYNELRLRGYDEQKALKKTETIIERGEDVDEAKEAYSSLKEHYKTEYQKLIDAGKERQKQQEEDFKKRDAALKKSIMDDKQLLGTFEFDKTLREKAYESITKTVHTDSKTGRKMTAVQKFLNDNPDEYMKILGVMYAATDGFKDFGKLVNSKVKKEMNKNIKELERTLSNTRLASDGGLDFVGMTDPESVGHKFELDI